MFKELFSVWSGLLSVIIILLMTPGGFPLLPPEEPTTSDDASKHCPHCLQSFWSVNAFKHHTCSRQRKPTSLGESVIHSTSPEQIASEIISTLTTQFKLHQTGFRFKLHSTIRFIDGCLEILPISRIESISPWNDLRQIKNLTKINAAISTHFTAIEGIQCPYKHACSNKLAKNVIRKVECCKIELLPLPETMRQSECSKCKKIIPYKRLKQHLNSCVGEGTFCVVCEQNLLALDPETVKVHLLSCGRKKFPCKKHCGMNFTTASHRDYHSKTCRDTVHESSAQCNLANDNLHSSALGDLFRIIELRPNNDGWDYENVLEEEKPRLINVLQNHLEHFHAIKFYISIRMMCSKNLDDTDKNANFRTSSTVLLQSTDIDKLLNQHFDQLTGKIDAYSRNGSGWIMRNILDIHLNITKYTPLGGGSHMELPEALQKKKYSLLNIQTHDDRCFLYSCAAQKFPITDPTRRHRKSIASEYDDKLQHFDVEGLSWPMQLKDIPKFEANNNFSVNVIGVDELEEEGPNDNVIKKTVLFPRYSSTNTDINSTTVNLLHLKNESNSHFVLITNLSGLLRKDSDHNAKVFCPRCFHGFCQPDGAVKLAKHLPDCMKFKVQATEFPYDPHLTYDKFRYEITLPVFIVVDFECILPRVDEAAGNSTRVKNHHIPCGFSFKLVTSFPDYEMPLVTYRGEDCLTQFVLKLDAAYEHVRELLWEVVPMKDLTNDQQRQLDSATTCYLCHKPFADRDNQKMRDHCHYTGEYIGPAHRLCNFERKTDKRIPVIGHALSRYDNHLFIRELCRHEDDVNKVRLIPKTLENYTSIITPKFRFIDSQQHLAPALDKLVTNLTAAGSDLDNLHVLTEHVRERYGEQSQRKIELLSRKGIYPYNYMTSFEKFDEGLPAREDFYNELDDKHITESEWNHVLDVWNEFQIETMGQYHDLYVESDVLLLCDVIGKYRKLIIREFNLDPLHFYTLPGLSLQACLKKTQVKLDLINDIEQFLMVEKAIRGGISVISKRLARANNPKLSSYKPEDPTSHLLYIDANSLYAHAMKNKMPVGGFKWLKPKELDLVNTEWVKNYDDGSDRGYILEVDLDIPPSIHDRTDEYPLCAEHLVIDEKMISPLSKVIRENRGAEACFSSRKLTPNLLNKRKYVTDVRNLKFYLEHGAVLKKVHRVLTFKQSNWIEPFITRNAELRSRAVDEFERDLFKLLSNAFFGKSLESVRRRIKVLLLNTARAHRWQTSKLAFRRFSIFEEDLVAVELVQPKILLNKPISVGFTILELSKLHMLDFHYNTIKTRYPEEQSSLCFTDTDSLLYHIFTDNLEQDMMEMSDKFDFSNYPIEHPLRDVRPENFNRTGKFKDECKSLPILEFVGLRSKSYSILIQDEAADEQKARAAGVKKSVRDRELHHQRYYDALVSQGEDIMIHQKTFRSFKHNICTIEQCKIALTSYDDKRYVLPDHSTRAYGSYRNS